MRIEGKRREDGTARVLIDGVELLPAESQAVLNHSPDGFNWGYGGSGPSQLALAILLAAGLPELDATRLHHDFKWEHLAHLPETFTTELDVRAWAARRPRS